MRICLLVHNLNTKDGGGRFSHDLILNLKKSGYEILTLTNFDLLKNPFFNFFKIRKIFKNSDIIHSIDIWPNGFYARLISFGLKKPIVITALGTRSVAPFYSLHKFPMKWVCNGARLVAISDYTRSEIKKIVPGLEIEVIPPGFNLDFWSGDEASESDAVKYNPYILSVGIFKFRKGYHNSIRAFAVVAKKFEHLNYVIVGQEEESDYVKELKNIIRENNLENRVFFISSGIDDSRLLGFYRNAELFVLTSIEENHHFEGFGIVYLEAAASGLPIVATYDSGATSATKDGYNSILVPQNDPQETADAVIRILSDDTLKIRLKNNSREWVKEFSWDKILKKYIKIYNTNAKHN